MGDRLCLTYKVSPQLIASGLGTRCERIREAAFEDAGFRLTGKALTLPELSSHYGSINCLACDIRGESPVFYGEA